MTWHVLPGRVYDKTKPAIVYRAINTINGHSYIGVTTLQFRERLAQHFRLAFSRGGRSKFAKALRKYGLKNFRFEVIQKCQNMEEAFCEERRLIALWKPYYNLTAGGEGVVGRKLTARERRERSMRPGYWLGKKRDPEMVARTAAKLRGRKLEITPERYAVLVESARRMREHQKPHTPEQTERQREIARYAASTRRRTVICLTDGKIFGSMSEADKYYKLHRGAVSEKILSGGRTRAGLRFALKDGD